MATNDNVVKAEVQTEAEKIAKSFLKEDLLTSKKFEDRKDLVAALLEDGKNYTIDEVEGAINAYLKKEVK